MLLLDSPSPEGSYSWVNYSSRRTESSSEHFASDLSLLKADAHDVKISGARIRTYEFESKGATH